MTKCPTCGGPEGLVVAQETVECLRCQDLRWKHLGELKTGSPDAAAAPGESAAELRFADFANEVDREIHLMHLDHDNRAFFADKDDPANPPPSKARELETLLTLYWTWIEHCAVVQERIEKFPDSIRQKSCGKFLTLLDKVDAFLADFKSSIAAYERSLALNSAAEIKRNADLQYDNLAAELDRQMQFMRLELPVARHPDQSAEDFGLGRIAVYQKWIDIFAAFPERIDRIPESIRRRALEKFIGILDQLESDIAVLKTEMAPAKKPVALPNPRPLPPAETPLSLNLPGPPKITPESVAQFRDFFRRNVAPNATDLNAAVDRINAAGDAEFSAIYARWEATFNRRGIPIPAQEFQMSIARREYWIGQFEAINKQLGDVPDSDAAKADLSAKLGAMLGNLKAANDTNRQTIKMINDQQAARDTIVQDTNVYLNRILNDVNTSRKATFEAANARWSNSFRQ
jgi:hypothetical protein